MLYSRNTYEETNQRNTTTTRIEEEKEEGQNEGVQIMKTINSLYKEPPINLDNPEPKRRPLPYDEWIEEVRRNYGAQGSCCERDRD